MDTTNSSEKPQRRVKHGQRPTEPLADWPAEFGAAGAEQPAATSGDAPDLQQLRALALAATPGPWFYQENSDAYTHIVRPTANPNRIIASGTQTSEAHGEPTGRYIAAANPAVVLGLIARIGTLEDSFKLALGSLALKDCNEADRIGKQYRQQAVRIESAAAPAPSDWREIAAQACYGQRENRDALKMPEDVAYNQAIENCMDAIRNLPDGPASPATASGDELPELPSTNYNGYSDGREPLYTAAQMREYARAAVSALASPQD